MKKGVPFSLTILGDGNGGGVGSSFLSFGEAAE